MPSVLLDMGHGVTFEKIPEWVKVDEALNYLSWNDKDAIEKSNYAFAIRYDAEALGSPDPNWKGSQGRSIQASVDERLMLVALALWLVAPSSLVGHQILHFGRENDPKSRRQFASLNQILVAANQIDNIPTTDEFQSAVAIFDILLNLSRDKGLWISVRTLIAAATERNWEVRYALLWIVLEALCGPEDGREITYRISQRIALFLGKSAKECKAIFNSMKKAYVWRSKIVHGMRLTKLTEPQSIELMNLVDKNVRGVIVKILMDPELVSVFESKRREEYLDSLLFSRIS